MRSNFTAPAGFNCNAAKTAHMSQDMRKCLWIACVNSFMMTSLLAMSSEVFLGSMLWTLIGHSPGGIL